jgi:hypothetical protein
VTPAGRKADDPAVPPRRHLKAAQSPRIWDWTLMIVIGVIVVFTLIGTIGPTVRYWFSGQRDVVDTLSSSSIFAGEGAARVDAAKIGGIVGTRPLAIIALSSSDPLAADDYGTCKGVVGQIPALIVAVVVDGSLVAGCEGEDVEFGSGVDTVGWDYVFWQTQSGADSLLVRDVPAIARQLALAYDAEVKGGRVIGAEREFSAPPNRWVLTILVAVAVVVAAIALFFGLQWASRRYLAAREQRRAWEAERDGIDGELGDIAVIMVDLEPGGQGGERLAKAVGAVSEDYLASLDDLDGARPGDDLSGLHDRVGQIRQRLEFAAAHR